jgi:hypothetical protein
MEPIKKQIQSWDGKKTLLQNYASIGLAPILNASNAGVKPVDLLGNNIEKNVSPVSVMQVTEEYSLADLAAMRKGLHRAPTLVDTMKTSDDDSNNNNNGNSNNLPIPVPPEVKDPRRLSENEVSIVKRLRAKYDDDYEAMAHDKKINTYQHTSGKLKRMCEKYLAEKAQRSTN